MCTKWSKVFQFTIFYSTTTLNEIEAYINCDRSHALVTPAHQARTRTNPGKIQLKLSLFSYFTHILLIPRIKRHSIRHYHSWRGRLKTMNVEICLQNSKMYVYIFGKVVCLECKEKNHSWYVRIVQHHTLSNNFDRLFGKCFRCDSFQIRPKIWGSNRHTQLWHHTIPEIIRFVGKYFQDKKKNKQNNVEINRKLYPLIHVTVNVWRHKRRHVTLALALW